jgi:hypothetical protein
MADVCRDWPGQVTDILEQAVPGLTALCFQGACGDINFRPEWETPERCQEPGRAVAAKALEALASSRLVEGATADAALDPRRNPARSQGG